MAVAVITLPRRAQLSAAVMSAHVAIYSRGAMRGAKRWRWVMYAASSRSLMVKNLWGFSLVRILAHMAVLNVSQHMCHFPVGL